MKTILTAAFVLMAITVDGQEFGLVRSQIKSVGSSSAAGAFTIAGEVVMPESSPSMSGGPFAVQGSFIPLAFKAPAPVATAIAFAKSDGNLRLSWSSLATGYLLESTSNLRPIPVWTILDLPRTTAGSTSFVTIPFAPTSHIYRLRHASSLP